MAVLYSEFLCYVLDAVPPKEGLSICMCEEKEAYEYWGPEETTVAR